MKMSLECIETPRTTTEVPEERPTSVSKIHRTENRSVVQF